MPRSRVHRAAKGRVKRPWRPAQHRELVLYLVGLVLVGTCVLIPVIHFWEYLQAEWAFADEVERGRAVQATVEKVDDRGSSSPPADAAYIYDEASSAAGLYDMNWVRAGFYSIPQTQTDLVHSLERGYVVIYYDDPAPGVLSTLKRWVGLFHEDPDGVIVVPLHGLGESIVLTAWQRRLRLSQFDPNAAAAFIDAFRGRGRERRVR